MRALTWMVGVLVILLGCSEGIRHSSGWAAAWISAAVLWFFVGVVLGVVKLAKLVSARMGAGGLATGKARQDSAPAPKQGESIL
jgi:hypothetical protein